MQILITGSQGFLGSNLKLFLQERNHTVIEFNRSHSKEKLTSSLQGLDCIVHLAGVNRNDKDEAFYNSNVDLTKFLVDSLSKHKDKIPLIFSSTTHAGRDDVYGKTKEMAEEILLDFKQRTDGHVNIFKLPNVYGKWCKPNYNSAIATFCHNIANNLEIDIHDPDTKLRCVYIDDVLDSLYKVILNPSNFDTILEPQPIYESTIKETVDLIKGFKDSRSTLEMHELKGFAKTLYSTFLSYLSPSEFSYKLEKNEDERGFFSEILRTESCGQFSVFTAHPGITRGGHYHHTKTEKFLVVSGKARFNFKNMLDNRMSTLEVDDQNMTIVDTIPGWAHDITNIGNSELIVLLWANESFDEMNPDTYNIKMK